MRWTEYPRQRQRLARTDWALWLIAVSALLSVAMLPQ